MPDHDYPDDLPDDLLNVDPSEVAARQLDEGETPADEAEPQGRPPSRARTATDARKRKIVWATLGIAALVIAGLGWHLMHSPASTDTPAPPALAHIQQLASQPIQAPTQKTASPPTAPAPKSMPPMTVRGHAPASATTVASRPAPASTAASAGAPAKPASTHHTVLVPAVPIERLAPPPPATSSKLKGQVKALKGKLKQAQAKVKTEHAKYLHQLHIGQSEYQKLKHVVPGKARVTAVLRDGVVLTLPNGKRRIISQGDTLQ